MEAFHCVDDFRAQREAFALRAKGAQDTGLWGRLDQPQRSYSSEGYFESLSAFHLRSESEDYPAPLRR
jgi:hypothetical protein